MSCNHFRQASPFVPTDTSYRLPCATPHCSEGCIVPLLILPAKVHVNDSNSGDFVNGWQYRRHMVLQRTLIEEAYCWVPKSMKSVRTRRRLVANPDCGHLDSEYESEEIIEADIEKEHLVKANPLAGASG